MRHLLRRPRAARRAIRAARTDQSSSFASWGTAPDVDRLLRRVRPWSGPPDHAILDPATAPQGLGACEDDGGRAGIGPSQVARGITLRNSPGHLDGPDATANGHSRAAPPCCARGPFARPVRGTSPDPRFWPDRTSYIKMLVPVKATRAGLQDAGDPVEVGALASATSMVGQAGRQGDPDGEEYPLATE